MARDWRAELTGMEDTVDAQQIVDALKRHGYSKTDIAKALQEFMEDNPTAGTPTPAAPTKLTVAEVLEMIKDPARHADLKARFDAMTDADKATLKAEIAKVIASSQDISKKGQAVQAISGYMNNWARSIQAETDKNKKIALAKEIVNFLADRKGSQETTSAIPSAIAIIKRSNLGNFQNTLINALKSGSPMSEGIKLAQKLLDHVELTWEDLGMELQLNESSNTYSVNDIDLLARIRTELKLV